jgi:hypothetical protein
MFYRISTASCSSYSLVFPLFNLLPLDVSCWKIQPTKFGIRAWFKEVFWQKFEEKEEDKLKEKLWPAQAVM